MKNNCLTYLLDLWDRGHRFQINYNGNHCYGVNNKKVFELGDEFKQDLIRGFSSRGSNNYTPIEIWHEKETIARIFKLTEKQCKTLADYYSNRVTIEDILE